MCMCVYAHHLKWVEGVGSLEDPVMENCERPDVGAGNQA